MRYWSKVSRETRYPTKVLGTGAIWNRCVLGVEKASKKGSTLRELIHKLVTVRLIICQYLLMFDSINES